MTGAAPQRNSRWSPQSNRLQRMATAAARPGPERALQRRAKARYLPPAIRWERCPDFSSRPRFPPSSCWWLQCVCAALEDRNRPSYCESTPSVRPARPRSRVMETLRGGGCRMATEFLALDMRRAGARRFCSTSRPLRLPASPFGKRPSHPPCRLDSNPKASARMSQDGNLEDRASGYSVIDRERAFRRGEFDSCSI